MRSDLSRWWELDGLFDRYCEGLLTRAESSRLEQLLRADREARRRFLAYLYLDGALRWEGAVGAATPFPLGVEDDPLGPWEPREEEVTRPVASCQGDEYAILDEPNRALPVTPRNVPYSPTVFDNLPDERREVSPKGFVPWLVAVVFFAALVFGISRWENPSVAPPVALDEMHALPAAWITLLHEDEWADEQTAYGWGSPVRAGSTLQLKSGLARLVFASGAEVVLEGPVAFTPDSAVAGQLKRGKLVARVETDQAQGFTIRTPTAQIVDLGTEFGVTVNEEGQTETHVFAGRVLAHAIGGKRRTEEPLQLQAGQAVRVASQSLRLSRMTASQEMFTRHTPPRQLRPILHYKMEDAAGPLVDQQGGHTAREKGGGGFLYRQAGVPPGTFGAISIGPDGTGFSAGLNHPASQWNLDAAASAKLDLVNNFTVMAWLYLPETPTGVVKIVGQSITKPTRGWAFGVREAAVARGIYFVGHGIEEFSSGASIRWTGGQWHHIAVTKSNAEGVKFYLDGNLVATDSRSTARRNFHRLGTSEFYTLGRGNDFVSEPHDGRRIDEFRVYNAVLSREEIILAAGNGQ